ncbi:MAG TPA: ABC transporter ATP-binding protein [Gaiellaceae bacterium]|nr:ABC transporter ATP-binding protein [Gaiellaceae bacterium]
MTDGEDETTRPAAGRARTFVRLLAFLRPYRASLAVSSLLAIGSQVAGILVPVLTGIVIDELSGDPDTTILAFEIAAVVALGLLRGALMLGRRLISGRQALAVEYDLRDELYGHFLRLSFGFYDRSQTGQLMSRATIDLQSVRFFLGYGLIFFAQHVVTIVVVSAVLFVYSWKLALVALAITPVVVLVAYRYSQVSHPVLREVQQQLAEVATVAEESIAGVHVVKSFSQEERRSARFSEAADAVFDRTLAANRQRALYVPLLTFLPLVAQAAVLLVAGRMVVSGSLSIGDFFAFNLLLAMLVMPLRMLGMWVGQAQRATAAGERIFEILDEPEEIADAPDARPLPPGPGALVFEDVDFGYEPGRPVLEGVDLELAPGRTVALIGRTGSGKTTLAALVPRFYDASAGRVLVDGVDVRELERRSLRREIGVISQDPFLFSASIRDNIAFGMPDAPHDAVEAAARAAQAHDFILELPQGYDTVVGERGITLSGGQRQRIAIARALLIDPRILVLDDATASVDATTEARIRAGLQEVMRDRTTIIIAHRLSTIALADEIVVLDHGRVAARGTQAELLEESPLFREIHEHGLLQQVVAG